MTTAIQKTLNRQAAAKKAWRTIRKNTDATSISKRCSKAAARAWDTIRRTYSKRQIANFSKKAVATRRRNLVLQFAQ